MRPDELPHMFKQCLFMRMFRRHSQPLSPEAMAILIPSNPDRYAVEVHHVSGAI
jgi:hypothetical protein